MKRQAIRLQDLAERSNLLLATHRALRGKRERPSVWRWLADQDRHLAGLASDILSGAAPRGRLRRFAIHDPKQREISVHPLTDRVLHHAILNLAEPRFEQMLVPTSFACRPDLGVHAAVQAVQGQLQRHAWWVQVDVAAYFSQIDHAILMDLLRRRFKGEGFLALLQRILDQGLQGRPGPPACGAVPAQVGHAVASAALAGCGDERPRGLPIGALTSQHFANAYLDGADRFLLALPQVRGHVRYMDDIVWWCDGPKAGAHTLAALQAHLADTRRLSLKPSVRQGPSRRGLAFCGHRIRPGLILPSRRKLARYRQAAGQLQRAERGAWPQDELQRAHDGLAATLAHTQSLRFRQRVWAGTRADCP